MILLNPPRLAHHVCIEVVNPVTGDMVASVEGMIGTDPDCDGSLSSEAISLYGDNGQAKDIPPGEYIVRRSMQVYTYQDFAGRVKIDGKQDLDNLKSVIDSMVGRPYQERLEAMGR